VGAGVSAAENITYILYISLYLSPYVFTYIHTYVYTYISLSISLSPYLHTGRSLFSVHRVFVCVRLWFVCVCVVTLT